MTLVRPCQVEFNFFDETWKWAGSIRSYFTGCGRVYGFIIVNGGATKSKMLPRPRVMCNTC